ncbi:unnamed protein product [Caenorhabditis angaria]|uniref:Thioredoxin domain-containing protein n=1 Tax=Caenorhabditis angaria TaxID=860376 RepID=A0A9P1MTW5_9PELO|nr:unnamed protein product [Caenorhabditis angaria]
MIIIENEEHFNQIFDAKKNEKLILAYFTAKWCGPCQRIAPIVTEFSEQFAEKFEFLKIDLDENEEISDRFNVDCIPTFLVFKKWVTLNFFEIFKFRATFFAGKLSKL